MPTAYRDDIVIDGIELKLYRSPGSAARTVKETSIPSLSNETFEQADVPLQIESFHLGMGYSQRLMSNTYAYGINADPRYPRLLLPGPEINSVTLTGSTEHARCARDYNGNLYVGAGRYVYEMASGTGAPSQARDLGASNRAWAMEVFRNELDVGLDNGAGTPQDMHRNVVGTWGTLTGIAGRALAQVWWDTDYRLVRQDTGTTIYHASGDPSVAGNWAGPVTIGDASSAYSINQLIASFDHLYASKPNGLYDLDGNTGRSPNIAQQMAHVIDAENGVATMESGGNMLVGHRKGLMRVITNGEDYGKIYVVQPGYSLPNETPIRGIVTAMTQEGGWIVAAVYNGTDTYICWGRDLNEGETSVGPSPMLWHGGLIRLEGLSCYLLHISNLTSPPRLWIGAGSASAGYNLRWCVLPRSEHPLQDTEYRFSTTYSLYLAGQDWERAATPKNLLEIQVEGDNHGAGVSSAFYYNTEGGAYGLFGTAQSSPQSNLVPASEIIGRRIGFRIDGSGNATAGAVIRSILMRAAARVRTRAIRTYQVVLSEGQGDNFRSPNLRDPQRVWDQLRNMESGSQVSVRDELGESLTCLVHAPVTRTEIEEITRGDKSRTIQVVNITLSILSRTGTTGTWDAFNWDSGTVWG